MKTILSNRINPVTIESGFSKSLIGKSWNVWADATKPSGYQDFELLEELLNNRMETEKEAKTLSEIYHRVLKDRFTH